MSHTALIVGVSSQDGSYLADLLVDKGYDVIGTNQPHSVRDVCRIAFAHVGLDWEAHAKRTSACCDPPKSKY